MRRGGSQLERVESEKPSKRPRATKGVGELSSTMEDGVRAGAARGVPQRINAGASKAPVKKMTISLKKGTEPPHP